MVNLEVLMTGVLGVSVVTNLTVEAIKKLVGDRNWNWNVVSCVVTLILSVAASGAYVVTNNLDITAKLGISIVAFTYVSWLVAMLGYDKIREALGQVKNPGEE